MRTRFKLLSLVFAFLVINVGISIVIPNTVVAEEAQMKKKRVCNDGCNGQVTCGTCEWDTKLCYDCETTECCGWLGCSCPGGGVY